MPHPGQFTPVKRPVPIVQEAEGPMGWSWQVRKISSPLRFHLRTVQPVASRYTDWVIATQYVLGEFETNMIRSHDLN